MQRKIRRDEAVEELVSRTNETLRKLPPEKHKILKNWFDRVGDKLTDWSTTLVQVRTVANLLDGGPLGPWHDYLFSRSAEAQTAELDMNGEVLVNVGDAIEKYVEENPGRMTDMIDTALVPVGRLTRYEVISIAFNVGNESNFDKLIRGRRWQGREQEVITLLKKLDAKDLKFVQNTWNTLESIYPKLAELEKRVSGVEPEKIERRPLTLTLNSGETITLEGGYFPLKYDPDLSEAGRKQETGPMAGLVEEGYAPATTPRSHAKKRTGYAGPILLDFGYVLQRHLRGIIKDITHREFLIDALALLRDQRIKDAIKEHVGKEYTGVLHKWLKGIASDGAVSSTDGLNALDSLVESSRGRVSTVAMGYKISTMLSQLAGLPNVIEYMGKHYGAAGLRELASSFATFYSNPVRNMSHTNENSILHEIETKSGEMRHRWQNIDRDWRQRLSELSNLDIIRTTKFGINKDKIELLATKAMWDGMVFAERLITGPAWRAAYNMALKEDATEQQAIHAGNDVVLASQGGAGPKDLSAIQRQRGLMRAFTMFFTPFDAQFSRLWLIKREMGQQVGVAAKMKYAPEMVMRVMLVTALPLIMADAITGRMSKECQGKEGGEFAECLIKWASIKALFSPAVTIPLLRDVAQSAEMYVTRGQIRDARFSPVFDMFSKIGKTTLYAGEAAFGDRTFEDDLFFDIFETSGYLTGLPTGQARISLEYMYDLMTDEPGADPKTPLDVMSGLAFRRPPERRE